MPDLGRRVTIAAAVAVAVFAMYYGTLLPGLDLGDTASFQVMAGSRTVAPRDAYPLYFAIGRVFTWLTPGDKAFALNLASAVEGATATVLLLLVATELSGSMLAGIAVSVLFAGSYTFWSQSIIAEVYALHMCFVAGTIFLLLGWERRPTLARLALFFLVYALGFGNHLSMILLAPAFSCFLLLSAPHGWRSMVTPRVVGLALVCASLGALQYAWNLHWLWLQAGPPPASLEALKAFWFDVTKSDWRSMMVLRIPTSVLPDRVHMYLFDLGQQFGRIYPLVAVGGAGILTWQSPRRALLIAGVYAVNVVFAFGYNVGDSHVFFLPSHLMLAMLGAPALAALDSFARSRGAVSLTMLVWAVWSAYDNFPALDRSGDTRPTRLLTQMTNGLNAQRAVLLTDLNWQIENGLEYLGKEIRPDLAHARLANVLLYAPALVRDNAAIGRATVMTERAAADLHRAYGPIFTPEPDAAAVVPGLAEVAGELAPGTPFVLCVLQPDHEFTLDTGDLARGLSILTRGQIETIPTIGYAALVGRVGDRPIASYSGSRPFRVMTRVGDIRVEVRMESWLSFDTIRRMGFGQVVADRHHALVVERGVSFVALDATGRPMRTAYRGGLFAPQPRYLIRAP
jgi:hypothetical protein